MKTMQSKRNNHIISSNDLNDGVFFYFNADPNKEIFLVTDNHEYLTFYNFSREKFMTAEDIQKDIGDNLGVQIADKKYSGCLNDDLIFIRVEPVLLEWKEA